MVSSSSELLQLKWNSYEANYYSAFCEIRENNKFYDVTIATHDGHALAHRVILSACSPVLARILDLNCHPQPLIYIRGIPIKHINTILDFMYKGEAHLSPDSIGEFLVSAEELKVKGLSKDKVGDEDPSKDLDSGSQNGVKNDLNSRDAFNQLSNQTTKPFLIKARHIFDTECVEERVSQHCEEDTSPQNTTLSSTSNNKKVITKNMSMTIPIRIRSPKTINGNFEEIASKTTSKIATCKWCGEKSAELNKCVNCKRKLPEDPKTINDPALDKNKESKRKSELAKKIESVIDSVLQQTASDGETPPKVRKVSAELNEEHFLVDSDGAPILNSFQEYDHFLLQSEDSPLAGSDEMETEYGNDRLFLTKSAEDKARFKAIVSSMITKSASNDGGLECLVCGKQFSGMKPKNNATSHVDHMHTDHLLHTCHVCGVIKNTSVALTRHMNLHKSDKIKVEDF